MDWLGRREKQLVLAVMVLTGAWGFWVDRIVGGGIVGAVVYSLLGALFVAVLLYGLTEGLPETQINRPVIAVGAILLFGIFAAVQYEILGGISEQAGLLIIGASSVGFGVVIGYISGDDTTSGLVQGMATGVAAAFLLVLIAIQQSLSMRPALTGIILIALIIGPPILGVIVGIGGAIGGSIHSFTPVKSA